MSTARLDPAARSRTLAPGARVVIRDEEWIVRSVNQASFGGDAVRVVGTSELVRNKEAVFLTDLDEVRELRPEETQLVLDTSPRYRRSRLYLESLLRCTPPTTMDNRLFVGHRAAIRRANYQLQPAAKALDINRQLRPRILMADGVGLGKTIEAGILLSELIRRGRGDRILVVALKSILEQFQMELWARFTIPLVRLDSEGIRRIQSRIPSNMNPFYFYDRVIISVDTLKKDEKYRRYLEECDWDVVVVDECQNVAVRTSGGSSSQSKRARLARLLSTKSEAMILTSATPHDGRMESFASLIHLLEPTAIADPADYKREDIEHYYLRRFKKDILHEAGEAFAERDPKMVQEPASSHEDRVFARFPELEFKTIARDTRSRGRLFRMTLLKSFLSSPAACLATIDHRLDHKDLADEGDPAACHDVETLKALRTDVAAVTKREFSKYQALLDTLRSAGFDRPDNDERIVIFSERIPTLRFLEKELQKDLELPRDRIAVFEGTLEDTKQQDLVRSFGRKESPIRILLASDAASEGVNLHFYCHRLVHFDLPWSFITLEQRNGRIDRYGQSRRPGITYLLTIPADERMKGDLRVLERLIEKEEVAHRTLGDVAWLMGLHDSELEEDRIARGLEQGEAPDEIIPDTPAGGDLMQALFGGDGEAEPAPSTATPQGLFADDLAFAREAFEELGNNGQPYVEWHAHLGGFTFHPPEDLKLRYRQLPAELLRDGPALKLTTDRQRVVESLERAREKESGWPEWELFWEHHPVAGWLNDRLLASFDRHEAPVIVVDRGLASGERMLLFQGVVSNRRSRPVIVEWFGLVFQKSRLERCLSLDEIFAATGFDRGGANPGRDLPGNVSRELQDLLAPSVSEARDHMRGLRLNRSEDLGKSLREGMRRLEAWRRGKRAMNERKRAEAHAQGRELRKDEARRVQDEVEEADRIMDERKRWIDEVMRTVEEPYLRIAAAFVPRES